MYTNTECTNVYMGLACILTMAAKANVWA